jgi:LysM repeat protein
VETTATAAAPFTYVVEEGDTLVGLADKFGLDPDVGFLIIMDYNNWEQGRFLVLGETIIIPHPDAQLFTPSPIPALVAGSEILYRVLPGDTVASIAEQFLSTVDAIIAANEIGDPNNIGVGDILFVPIRLITATFGPPPSATITPGGPTFTPTATPTASATQ